MRNIAIGGTIFALGLGEKVILADTLAAAADPVFDSAAAGMTITLLEPGRVRWHALSRYISTSPATRTW